MVNQARLRTKSGCLTCKSIHILIILRTDSSQGRLRKKKCDETRPICLRCSISHQCRWPTQQDNARDRRLRKTASTLSTPVATPSSLTSSKPPEEGHITNPSIEEGKSPKLHSKDLEANSFAKATTVAPLAAIISSRQCSVQIAASSEVKQASPPIEGPQSPKTTLVRVNTTKPKPDLTKRPRSSDLGEAQVLPQIPSSVENSSLATGVPDTLSVTLYRSVDVGMDHEMVLLSYYANHMLPSFIHTRSHPQYFDVSYICSMILAHKPLKDTALACASMTMSWKLSKDKNWHMKMGCKAYFHHRSAMMAVRSQVQSGGVDGTEDWLLATANQLTLFDVGYITTSKLYLLSIKHSISCCVIGTRPRNIWKYGEHACRCHYEPRQM